LLRQIRAVKGMAPAIIGQAAIGQAGIPTYNARSALPRGTGE
jgi:hypothetical protein